VSELPKVIRIKGRRTLFTAQGGIFVVMHGADTLYRGKSKEKAIAVFDGKVKSG